MSLMSLTSLAHLRTVVTHAPLSLSLCLAFLPYFPPCRKGQSIADTLRLLDLLRKLAKNDGKVREGFE